MDTVRVAAERSGAIRISVSPFLDSKTPRTGTQIRVRNIAERVFYESRPKFLWTRVSRPERQTPCTRRGMKFTERNIFYEYLFGISEPNFLARGNEFECASFVKFSSQISVLTVTRLEKNARTRKRDGNRGFRVREIVERTTARAWNHRSLTEWSFLASRIEATRNEQLRSASKRCEKERAS